MEMEQLTFSHSSCPSSLYSTKYPVILAPPSTIGGIHSRSTVDFVQSVTLGVGGPGGAENEQKQNKAYQNSTP